MANAAGRAVFFHAFSPPNPCAANLLHSSPDTVRAYARQINSTHPFLYPLTHRCAAESAGNRPADEGDSRSGRQRTMANKEPVYLTADGLRKI